MARSAKRAQVIPAPTIAENVVIEPENKTEEETIVKKKKFTSDDRIPCKSVLSGKTHLLGKRTNMIYTFLGRNDTIGIEYQDLVAEVRAGTKLLFHPMIVIEDQNFINEFPKDQATLNRINKSVPSSGDISRVFYNLVIGVYDNPINTTNSRKNLKPQTNVNKKKSSLRYKKS